MFKSLAAIIVAAAALSACAGAEADLERDLQIGGTDPAYWTVEVKQATGKSLISILGEASFEGSLPVKSKTEGGGFLMTSATPRGEFVMNFTHKECYDGLAESPRPWTVTVDWNGETLNGCAFAMPDAKG